MADPWSDDFAALDERARQDLRPMAATRALRHQETKSMRFSFKQRPMFAALVVLAVLLVAPLAYAVVNRVFLHIDPDKSAPEIEKDLKDQLDHAGVPGAEVKVEKPGDGELKVQIKAEAMGSDLEIVPPEVEGAQTDQRSVRVGVGFVPSEDQAAKLHTAMSSAEVKGVLDGDLDGDQLAAALKQKLADQGIDADVSVTGAANVMLTIKAIH